MHYPPTTRKTTKNDNQTKTWQTNKQIRNLIQTKTASLNTKQFVSDVWRSARNLILNFTREQQQQHKRVFPILRQYWDNLEFVWTGGIWGACTRFSAGNYFRSKHFLVFSLNFHESNESRPSLPLQKNHFLEEQLWCNKQCHSKATDVLGKTRAFFIKTIQTTYIYTIYVYDKFVRNLASDSLVYKRPTWRGRKVKLWRPRERISGIVKASGNFPNLLGQYSQVLQLLYKVYFKIIIYVSVIRGCFK